MLSLYRFFYNVLVKGVFRPFAKPLYQVLIKTELFCERSRDRFDAPSTDTGFVDEHLTALIKTFERPKIVQRLVESIRIMYPNMQIIIVDDSREPVEIEGVQIIALPYDSGVSAGRNEGLEHVKTKYMMLLDDDFVCFRHTRVMKALQTLEHYESLDMVGGAVIDLPFYRTLDYRRERLYPTNAESVLPVGTRVGDTVVQDKIANFYIARTESIRKIGWDPEIKRLDHADFFTRAKGILAIGFDPDFKILHCRTPFDKAYMKKRMDVEEDRDILLNKYDG